MFRITKDKYNCYWVFREHICIMTAGDIREVILSSEKELINNPYLVDKVTYLFVVKKWGFLTTLYSESSFEELKNRVEMDYLLGILED